MSEPETEAGDGVESYAADPEPNSSLLSELRSERQALTEQRTLDLPIPGYARMVARYRAISYETIDKIEERARKARNQQGTIVDLNAAADVLAQSCVGIFVREDSGELVALSEHPDVPPRLRGDDPIRYDDRLCEIVGVETAGKARTRIHNVFGVHEPETGNDLVLMAHQTEILRWARQANADADADF